MAKRLLGSHYSTINLVDCYIHQIGQSGTDDFPAVCQRVKQANVLIFGTPVYWIDMSGYLKTFIAPLA